MSAELWPIEPQTNTKFEIISTHEAPADAPAEIIASQTGEPELPSYCFVPEIAYKFTERERTMLTFMIRNAGTDLAPGQLGEQVGNPKRSATQMAVSGFLAKARDIAGVGESIVRGGGGNKRFCRWTGEPAIVEWSDAVPARTPGYPNKEITARRMSRQAAVTVRLVEPKPERQVPERQQGVSPSRQVRSTATYEARPALPEPVTRLERDEELGQTVLRSWHLAFADTVDGRVVTCKGKVLEAIDGYGTDIVEVVAQSKDGVTVDDLRRFLNEYAVEPIGFKGVLDRLPVIRETLGLAGVDGWQDADVADVTGEVRRKISFRPGID